MLTNFISYLMIISMIFLGSAPAGYGLPHRSPPLSLNGEAKDIRVPRQKALCLEVLKTNKTPHILMPRLSLLPEEKISFSKNVVVKTGSGLGAATTITGVWAMFGLVSGVPVLFGEKARLNTTQFAYKSFVIGTTAAILALPDVYLTYHKGLTSMVLWGRHTREEVEHAGVASWLKKHFACRSASEVLESTIKGVFIGGGLIVLTGKSLFALYEDDTNNGGTIDNGWFTGITMTGFTIYQIFRVEEMLRNAWLTVSHFTHKKWRHHVAGDTDQDDRRKGLKRSFAKGFRKLLSSQNPHTPASEKAALRESIENLYAALAKDHQGFQEQIALLQAQRNSLKTRSLSEEEKASLRILSEQIQELKALEVLVALKRLYTFGTNDQDKETYAPQSTWKPMWWYAAKGLGVATVGLAATCIWYGWQHVVNATYGDVVLEHNDDDAFTLPEATYDSLGTLLTLPYLGILLKVVPNVFAKKASLLMGYNPTLHDETIRDETVIRSRTKGIAHLVKGVRSWFAGLPVALVGGTGMALNGIPLKKQWWTLIPNMIAAGCMEDIGSEPDLYELLDHFLKATEEEHQKQALATLLTRASRYLKHLGKEELVALEGFLQKPWKTIFPEEEGEEREEGSDEGQGASGSSSSDSPPQGSPPESAQGSPPRGDERLSFLAETTLDGAFGNPRTRAHTGESGVIVDSDSDDERIRPAPPRASEHASCVPSFTPQKKKHKHKKKKRTSPQPQDTLTEFLLPEGSNEAEEDDPEGGWITVTSRKKVRKGLSPLIEFKKFG